MLKLAVVFAIVISTVFHESHSYPSGAPSSQCGDMRPQHGASSQPAGTSPYSVKVEKPYYMPGENVTVSIESSSNDIIGYLIQARQVGGNSAVGSFLSVPANGRHLNCGNAKGAVTHSTRLNVKKVTFEWGSLISLSGNISFLATVVKDKSTFWVKLESPELYKKEVPGPSQTIQSSVITVSPTSVSSYSQIMQTKAQLNLSYRVTEPKELLSPSSPIQSVQTSRITNSRQVLTSSQANQYIVSSKSMSTARPTEDLTLASITSTASPTRIADSTSFSKVVSLAPETSKTSVLLDDTNSKVTKPGKTSMSMPTSIADLTPTSIVFMEATTLIGNTTSFPNILSLSLPKAGKMSGLLNDTNSGATKPAKTSMSTPTPIKDSTPTSSILMHETNLTSSPRVVSSTPITSKTSCQYNDPAKCDGAQKNPGAMFIFFIASVLVFWQNAVGI